MTPSRDRLPAPRSLPESSRPGRKRGLLIAAAVVGGVALLGGLVWAAIAMLNNPAQAAALRDVFIVFMALEALLIGAALIVLVVQLALLTNLLQNEIKPILETTSEAARTVRGTAAFLSENMVDPVVKAYGYAAALRRTLGALRPGRRA